LAAWTFYLLLDLFSAFIKGRVFEKYRGNDTAELSARATERLHKSFGKKIVACKILFFAAAAAIALESIFQLEHPWLWWISVPAVIASTVTFATFLYALLDHLVWQSNAESTHKED
jgi:hypothetical protein